ncbi:MAG TPA: hypothetical protein VFU31_16235, partial [Candidatus Binatia bacterium]|nr:hypothetical protein [Candidatus Binatia bacterium]
FCGRAVYLVEVLLSERMCFVIAGGRCLVLEHRRILRPYRQTARSTGPPRSFLLTSRRAV